MNIVLRGQDGAVEQARRQLEDLVPVWVVLDYSQTKIVERELLLAKVSILGPEHFHELIAHHKEGLEHEHESSDEENPGVRALYLAEVDCRPFVFRMDPSIQGFWLLRRHFDININIFRL